MFFSQRVIILFYFLVLISEFLYIQVSVEYLFILLYNWYFFILFKNFLFHLHLLLPFTHWILELRFHWAIELFLFVYSVELFNCFLIWHIFYSQNFFAYISVWQFLLDKLVKLVMLKYSVLSIFIENLFLLFFTELTKLEWIFMRRWSLMGGLENKIFPVDSFIMNRMNKCNIAGIILLWVLVSVNRSFVLLAHNNDGACNKLYIFFDKIYFNTKFVRLLYRETY